MRKLAKDPVVRGNHKKAMQDIVQTDEWKLKNKESRLTKQAGSPPAKAGG
jgi:hypothetical protein